MDYLYEYIKRKKDIIGLKKESLNYLDSLETTSSLNKVTIS